MEENIEKIKKTSNLRCLEESLIIQGVLNKLGQLGKITLIDCQESFQKKSGLNSLVIDEGNNLAIGYIIDSSNNSKLKFQVEYNPKLRAENIFSKKDLINQEIKQNNIQKPNILLPFEFGNPLITYNSQKIQFNELTQNKEILKMIEMLDNAFNLGNLEIEEKLFSTKTYMPNKSGFYKLNHEPHKKYLEGFMVTKKHPNVGIRFKGNVSNYWFGEIIKDSLIY